MYRLGVSGLLVASLLLVPAESVAAQTAQGCQSGEQPHFTFGFADLKTQIGDAMGDAVTCEFPDPNGTGDVHQRTTTGLAFWRKSTNTPTFTDGFDHWAETPSGWVTWTGASVDPPTTSAGTAYPEVVVQSFLQSCESYDPNNPQLTAYCSCALEKFESSYSLSDFINIALELTQGGPVPREFTDILRQCIT